MEVTLAVACARGFADPRIASDTAPSKYEELVEGPAAVEAGLAGDAAAAREPLRRSCRCLTTRRAGRCQPSVQPGKITASHE
jgi:hypothetical protein